MLIWRYKQELNSFDSRTWVGSWLVRKKEERKIHLSATAINGACICASSANINSLVLVGWDPPRVALAVVTTRVLSPSLAPSRSGPLIFFLEAFLLQERHSLFGREELVKLVLRGSTVLFLPFPPHVIFFCSSVFSIPAIDKPKLRLSCLVTHSFFSISILEKNGVYHRPRHHRSRLF
jgi:hypothetical protein